MTTRTAVYVYRYDVAGSGAFPVDMLRYDSCWPSDTGSAIELTRGPRNGTARDDAYFSSRTVHLTSHRPPTAARWRSFGWHVVEEPIGERI